MGVIGIYIHNVDGALTFTFFWLDISAYWPPGP
jgi:hypothetical protein